MAMRIEEPSSINPTNVDWQLLMSKIDAISGGCQLVYLTNWFSTGAPTIPAGAKIEIRGMFFESLVEEQIEFIDSISDGTVYIYCQVSTDGLTATWYASNTAPVLFSMLQGYYSANQQDRCFFEMQKSGAAYTDKKRIMYSIRKMTLYDKILLSAEIEGSQWIDLPPNITFLTITGCSAAQSYSLVDPFWRFFLRSPETHFSNNNAGEVFIQKSIFEKWNGGRIYVDFGNSHTAYTNHGSVSVIGESGEILHTSLKGAGIQGEDSFFFSTLTSRNNITSNIIAGNMPIEASAGIFRNADFGTFNTQRLRIVLGAAPPGIGDFLRVLPNRKEPAIIRMPTASFSWIGSCPNGANGGGGGCLVMQGITNNTWTGNGASQAGDGGYGSAGGWGISGARLGDPIMERPVEMPNRNALLNYCEPGKGGPAIILVEWGISI